MKKLFSYLLISSMVVLSSCTNYDDQFDDLNTQINSLKSQIEGFSSLSSGLTALQGTVASLQTAIANIPVTPATDISGLESTQATLTAALTSLAADVKALQDTLATAATAADVAALQTALTKAQSDLTDLLASNNVYTTEMLKITTPAELTFAESLAGKLGIINGSITVTQSSTMDATKLAAVLAKITTVTGNVIYNAKGTSVTPTAGFTKLSGVTDLTVDADGDISFPALVSAAVVTIKDNVRTTNVSLPVLASLTSLNGTTANQINLTGATGFDLGALTNYPVGTLTIITKGGLTNLDSLQAYQKAAPTVPEVTNLVITGATELSIDALTRGQITANKITEAKFSVWEGTTNSIFAKATIAVLPAIKAAAQTDNYNVKTMFPNATSVHIIGAATALSTTSTAEISVTVSGHTDLTTLILDGVLDVVTINTSTDINDLTITGSVKDLTIKNTAVTAMVLGNTTGKTGDTATAKDVDTGQLTIEDNEDMTSFTADKIDDITSLTITSNSNLATISMAALDSAGAAKVGNVDISGNKFVAQNVQLPSAYGVTPVVTGKIVSDSGLNSLVKYIDAHTKLTTPTVKVEYYGVNKVTGSDGKVYEVGSQYTSTSPAVEFGTGATNYNKTIGAITANGETAFLAVNLVPDGRSSNTQDAVFQTNSSVVANALSFTTADPVVYFDGGDGNVSETLDSQWRAAISDFDGDVLSTFVPEIAASLQAKVNAAGLKYTITSHNDYGSTAKYTPDVLSKTTGASSFASGATGTVSLTNNAGGLRALTVNYDGKSATATLVSADKTGFYDAIVNAFHKVGSPLSGVWSAVSSANDITITRLKRIGGTARTPIQDLGYTAYNALTFGAYSAAASQTNALQENAVTRAPFAVTKGWRLQAVNKDTAYKAANLEANEDAFYVGNLDVSGVFSATAVGANGQAVAASGTMQIPFAQVVPEDKTKIGADPSKYTDFTAWM